jgi:hypothetical protein
MLASADRADFTPEKINKLGITFYSILSKISNL